MVDVICPECDAAGHTVSLDIFGKCDLCGTFPIIERDWDRSDDARVDPPDPRGSEHGRTAEEIEEAL
jgi:hypothetical protein